ncbi:restriction endonuclease subunit S [Flavobacterium celericrescens]|uniref:Type I restriction modification DNA specificity domain-containing protein n=1 Tax=Flavobacterium celericrescens TaxID=2709780 RepID=A0ABX0IHR1_9FLAO|nr:restriction endonuclease subunit S [Flavobacterium celericrescens]NHM04855.1 hypothetical protein [Flavobacterium celericrescens]
MKNNLPKGWDLKKLKDVVHIERGGSPRPIDNYITQNSEGINWIKISDATASDKYIYKTKEKITKAGLHKTRMVYEGDFILSNSMSFGKPYIMKTTGCIHDGWLLLRDTKKVEIDKEYLYYLLTSPIVSKQFNILASGTTVRNLNIGLVSSVNIPLPNLNEQKQIVAILENTFSKLDQASLLLKQNIEKIKQLNESALNKIFENKNYKSICLKNLIEKSENINPKINIKEKFTYIDITAIDKNIQKITNPNSFVGKDAPSRAKKGIKKGDIVFATTRPNLKNIAIVEEDYPNAVASTGFCVLRPNSSIIRNYLFYFLITDNIQDKIKPFIRGAQYPAISDKDLLNCEMPLPSLQEQQRIVSYLDQLTENNNKLLQHYQNKLEALQRLKNSVLESAFKGEFKKEQKAKTFNLAFYQMQLIGLSIEANKYDNIPQGEMAIAKDMYLLDRLFQVPTKMNFANHNLGPFAPEIKKGITNKTHFDKKNFPNSQATYVVTKNEEELFKTVSADLKSQVFNGISELNRKLFSKISPYKRAEAKELFATVLKCIEDTQSTDLPTIREAMKNWKIKIGQFKTKFDKFPEPNTQLVIKFIVKENWHLKVLK